jgi:hypothetical protein
MHPKLFELMQEAREKSFQNQMAAAFEGKSRPEIIRFIVNCKMEIRALEQPTETLVQSVSNQAKIIELKRYLKYAESL